MTLTDLARLFLFVREKREADGTTANAGARVEAIQRWCGGEKGQSWCAFFATMLLDIYFGGESPIPRTGSCDDILKWGRENDAVHETPHVEDLYLYVKDGDDAHHVGLVTDVDANGFMGLSGNTSEDGLSSNGDRVAERHLTLKPGKTVFVRFKAA